MADQSDVVIVGAGGFGREALQYAVDAAAGGWPYRVVGFVDDDEQALGGHPGALPIVAGIQTLEAAGTERFIIAIGDPVLRGEIATRIDSLGGVLVSLIHPTAYVAPSASVGAGALLCPFSLVATHAVVGPNVAMNVYGSIGHDAVVGGHTVISPYSAVTGAVHIGEESFLGSHCTISPGVSIGRRSKVSAGSVVSRDAQPGSLLVGNPAKGRVMFATGTAAGSDG